jgi:2-polyprenyl-3-methyl-5-hydroxy-6-metoxy-1,4-benzoquinol methylase
VQTAIRSRPCPACFLCGSAGDVLYPELHDDYHGVPGAWTFTQCRNPDCRLVWLDPMPLEEDIGRAYRDYQTHTVAEPRTTFARRLYGAAVDGHLRRKFRYRRAGRPWSRLLEPLVYLHPGGQAEAQSRAMFLRLPQAGARLLDLGCGNGEALSVMSQLGWQVEGIDTDPEAVEIARRRGLTVHLGELADRHYPADHFDAIHMNHVIEHVHQPIDLLRECHRILKPGGVLVVLTPNGTSWGLRDFGKDWVGLDPPRHLYVFRVANLTACVRAAGFEQVRGRTIARWVRFVTLMSETIRRRRSPDGSSGGSPRALLRARAVWRQFGERFALLSRPGIGEEIVMVAAKRR